MSNGKRRFLRSKHVSEKVMSNMNSPIVVLEKLPFQFEKSSSIKKEIIMSNKTGHSENDLRQKRNYIHLKIRKRKRKFTKLKKRYKETKVNSVSEKLLDICNNNSSPERIVNKLVPFKTVHKDALHMCSNSMSSPIVVLERLAVKLKPALLSDHSHTETDSNEFISEHNDSEKLESSTNKEIEFKEMPEKKSNLVESALNESEQTCIKLENETDINGYSKHNIIDTDVNINISNTRLLNNTEKIEVTNENESYERIMILSNNITGDYIISEENIIDETEIEENKNTVLSVNEASQDVFDDTNTVHVMTDTTIINDSSVCNETEQMTNKWFTLQEVCEQMAADSNAAGGVIDNWITDDNSTLNFNSETQFEREDEIGFDQNSFSMTKKQISEASKETKTRLFVEKCLKCNTIQVRINNRLVYKCKICESFLIYQCLVCDKQYKYAPGVYSHVARKHRNKQSANTCATEKGTTIKSCSAVKQGRQKSAKSNSKEKVHNTIDDTITDVINDQYSQFDDKEKHTFIDIANSAHSQILLLRDHRIEAPNSTTAPGVVPLPCSIIGFCKVCEGQFRASEGTASFCMLCRRRYVFCCSECGLLRTTYPQVRLHVLRKHAEKTHRCPNNCGLAFSYAGDCTGHAKRCRKRRCARCPKFRTYCSHVRDINNANLATPLLQPKSYCYKCGKYFEDRPSMMQHISLCGKLYMSYCEHCEFKTDSKDILISHIQTKHALELFWEAEDFRCDNCGEACDNYFRYNKHVDVCQSREQKV